MSAVRITVGVTVDVSLGTRLYYEGGNSRASFYQRLGIASESGYHNCAFFCFGTGTATGCLVSLRRRSIIQSGFGRSMGPNLDNTKGGVISYRRLRRSLIPLIPLRLWLVFP